MVYDAFKEQRRVPKAKCAVIFESDLKKIEQCKHKRETKRKKSYLELQTLASSISLS